MNEATQPEAVAGRRPCPECGAPLASDALGGLCPACLLRQGGSTDIATQPPAPPSEPLPLVDVARLFPQLEVQALVGKGGMGAVYRARQPALDRVVALKILPPCAASGSGFADRFNREARALARLSHPNIVAVHEFGQVNGLHYFIMEFVDGVNLRQLEKGGRLSPREALQLIPQICDALQYAHDQSVVHRDIKPENVLVDRKGRVKIADFGLAKILGREPPDLRLTGEGQVMGTPHYMAPEQVEKPQAVDHRADIYSLGVVFYELLTGELPLGKFPPPSRKVQIDVRLDDVVLHALEKEPERRYQHAGEVKTDVETIAGSPQRRPLQRLPSPSERRAAVGRSGWLIIAAAFILCLAASVTGFNAPPQLGIPLVLWGAVGFILVTTRALRTGGSAEQDLATVRTARQILLVDAIGFCLGALLATTQSSTLNPAFRTYVASACVAGIVVAVLRLCGREPWSLLLSPRTGPVPTARAGSGPSDPKPRAPRIGLALAVLAGLGLLWGGLHAWLTRRNRLNPPAIVPEAGVGIDSSGPASGAVAGAPTLTLGPVVEQVLPCSAPCRMQFFQFRTGHVITIGDGPGDTSDHAEDYRRAEDSGGLDLSVIGGKEGLQLAGRGCVFARTPATNWDTLTADGVAHRLRYEPWLNGVVELKASDLPATFLFKTATGERGILQALGVTDEPPGWNHLGVQLRYKLVEADSAREAHAQPATVGGSGNGAVERPKTAPPTFELSLEPGALAVHRLPDGRYEAWVTIHNRGSWPSPVFAVWFYVGDPARGGRLLSQQVESSAGDRRITEVPAKNEAGPIAPGRSWREGTLPFALAAGETAIFVVLDPEDQLRRPGGTPLWASQAVPADR